MSVEHIRATLRAVTRRVVEGDCYEDLAEVLDALAAMPEADDLRAEIAGRRLALALVYDRGDDEVERVLDETRPVLARLPLPRRAEWVRGACAGRPELVVRYLRPLLDEIRLAQRRAPEDEELARARRCVREALRWERGHGAAIGRPGSEPWREEDPAPRSLDWALEVIRRLVVTNRAHEEIAEAIDALEGLPEAATARGRSVIAAHRLFYVAHYQPNDEPVERAIQDALPVLATWPARARAETISGACVGRPALAEKYVPGVIAELEEALRQRPDKVGKKVLASIERSLERMRAGAPADVEEP